MVWFTKTWAFLKITSIYGLAQVPLIDACEAEVHVILKERADSIIARRQQVLDDLLDELAEKAGQTFSMQRPRERATVDEFGYVIFSFFVLVFFSVFMICVCERMLLSLSDGTYDNMFERLSVFVDNTISTVLLVFIWFVITKKPFLLS